MKAPRFAVFLLLLAVGPLRAATVDIRIDLASPGRVFEGIGGVSAGASTRLLVDYPEPQRSQVLDFLFKPRFGAGFQHLKVEIGGGENSTCGSEPSHAITRRELADPRPRGYEFWLMAEARKRNPKIILDCLPWTYPAWLKSPFSRESAQWFAAFLDVSRTRYGVELDWISAAQNEQGTDLGWIKNALRPTLDARGFEKVMLQAPDDDSGFWKIFDDLENDPALNKIIQAVGYHYVDGREPWQIDQVAKRNATEKAKESGKPLWASEEWSQSGGPWNGKGALYVARLMNKVYIRDRITKFEIWCPIDSIYDSIIWADTGVLQADTPWCGFYDVWPAVWAVAHTTQFAEPGWVYIDGACGQLDPKTWRGSHVALRDPRTGDWSLIVVTGDATMVRIATPPGTKAVHVWRSTAEEQFVRQEDVEPRDGKLEYALAPDAVYTFTTTTGQQKGSFGKPPERRPFPMPFQTDFEQEDPGSTPRYFSDQKGTFEVAREGSKCLAEIMPEQGILWYNNRLMKPHTLFGDPAWTDYSVEADVCVGNGNAEVGGRYADRNLLGYRLILDADGRWQLQWQTKVLSAGQLDPKSARPWHKLRLEMSAARIRGIIDGTKVADVEDASHGLGMAFLASSYGRVLFDNVRVAPLAKP